MARWVWALLVAVCVCAEDLVEDRRSKLPYVADAVGNKIPPPSGGPAPVGSPSNLLTPDRYEFYTFDESGELVKRLMTLEEIQAIVAAGEGNDGHLVTFANDDQPNIAFNFSQAPFTKVHNVVTNVQNVLKAQMEAQKNNPPTLTTLDTPDVSDSWSLILPTIFGNTGDDITPEKSSNKHTVPETETLEFDQTNDDSSLSKEGNNNLVSSSAATSKYESFELSTEKLQASSEVSLSPSTTTAAKTTTTSTTTTTTTAKPKTTSTTTTTTTTPKPRTTSTTTTTTAIPRTTTTSKPRTTTTTTTTTPKPRTTSTTTTTTAKPRTTSSTTTTTTTAAPKTPITSKPTRKPSPTVAAAQKTQSPTTFSTTSKPRTSSTVKPVAPITLAPRPTSLKTTTNKFTISTPNEPDKFDKIDTFDPATAKRPSSTEKITTQEKLSSFVPVSTVAYVTSERTTSKSTQVPKTTAIVASTTKRSVSTHKVSISSFATEPTPIITTYKPAQSTVYVTPVAQEIDRNENATTITTQSVSPSTAASSTEFMSAEKETKPTTSDLPLSINGMQENESLSPIFDIAQSISQITSDLGNNYPIASNSNLIDTSKTGGMDLESKENIELDIPNDSNVNITESKAPEIGPQIKDVVDNFVKISTIDPPVTVDKESVQIKEKPITDMETKGEVNNDIIPTTSASELPVLAGTTMDPILSESMGDLLFQIVNENPQNIVQHPETTETVKTTNTDNITTVTEKILNISATISKNEETTSIANGKTTTEKNKINAATNKPLQIEQISQDELSVEPTYDSTTSNISKIQENDLNKVNKVDKNNLLSPESSKEDKPQKTNQNAPENDLIKDKVTSNQAKLPSQKINPPIKEVEKPLKPTKDNQVSFTKVTEEQKPEKAIPSKAEKVKIQEVSVQNRINFESASEKSTEQPSKINKVHISDKLEVIEDQTSDLRPKIDDFKKKIQKVNIDDKELVNDRNSSWKLISTVKPPKTNEILKEKLKGENYQADSEEYNKDIILDVSKENQGLEVTTKDLGEDIAQFTELCNELAFRYWNSMTENIDKKRSFVLSPYSVTSMLAMMFMGARGATSGEMNEILKLDDMVTFNPHFTLKNISDSIETTPEAGVIVSAFIRELYTDRDKGKVLTFYKERAQHFYNGHVEEINFKFISDVIRRRTNLLVKRYSWGRISEYMKTNSIIMQPPLAAFSANVFQTDCTGSSVEGRDGEMYFVVSPTVRQRRLVPVPAVVYKKGFLAGYDPVLDATAAALGNTNSIVSTLFLMPGQQGNVVHAEDLEALERRLLDSNPTTPAWDRLLRTLLPRIGLELQIPRFSHKSIFNVSQTLKAMGLKDIFNENHADLGGLNGPSKDLYLSDMVQQTTFVTCGEDVIGEQHHIEEYPESLELTRRRRTSRWANGWDEPRDYQRAFHDPHDVGEAMHLPLHLRPRQARLPARNAQPARLKFDRPFLYFVRHNPSGMILYVGRYNPRLLP